MCVGVRVREPRTDFRLSPFPSPSASHPIPTSSYLRLRYTCIRRWTLLGQLLDPAWIDCESRPPVSCSCIPFLSRASYALGLDRSVSLGSPSHHAAAYRTGTTSVRADRPISTPFTLWAQLLCSPVQPCPPFRILFPQYHFHVILRNDSHHQPGKFSRLDNHNTPLAGVDVACLTGAP